MSSERVDEFDYMVEEGQISDFAEDNHGRAKEIRYAARARMGKDIQGIPWDRLNIPREKYRSTRLEQYKNYENVPFSGEAINNECKQVDRSGNYYEFFHNTRLGKPTILHFQLRNLVWATSKHDVYLMSNYSVMHWSSMFRNLSEVLNFAGHVAPTEVTSSLQVDFGDAFPQSDVYSGFSASLTNLSTWGVLSVLWQSLLSA